MPLNTLTGSCRPLFFYDASEEILLDKLRKALPPQPARREPAFRDPAPEYV